MSVTARQAHERSASRARAAGFSLIEVMVALVIVSIGLLGLAKMESLALSSTSVAGSRAIAAIEASSLASAMHANPGFWAAGLAPATATINYSGGAFTITDSGNSGLAGTKACLTAGTNSCTPAQMAAYDFQSWAVDLTKVLPAPLGTVTCSVTGFPVVCTVQIQWAETAVAGNAQQTLALAAPTYTLFVQP